MGKPETYADYVSEDGDGTGVDREGAHIAGLFHKTVLGVESNKWGDGEDYVRRGLHASNMNMVREGDDILKINDWFEE